MSIGSAENRCSDAGSATPCVTTLPPWRPAKGSAPIGALTEPKAAEIVNVGRAQDRAWLAARSADRLAPRDTVPRLSRSSAFPTLGGDTIRHRRRRPANAPGKARLVPVAIPGVASARG